MTRMPLLCSEAGCTAAAAARGACMRHYRQARLEGRLEVSTHVRDMDRVDYHAASGGLCIDLQAPCEVLSCRYHLAEFDVDGGRLNPELPEPCALRCAASGPMTLDEVGRAFAVSRERIRQIEAVALRKVERALGRADWPVEEIRAVLATRPEPRIT
jgi:sigma-70-like protein